MKKFYKMFIFALVFAMTMTTALVSPLSIKAADALVYAAAASATVGSTITIKGMKSSGVVGEELLLPVGSTDEAGATITATVTNSAGRVILTHVKVGDETTFAFTPSVAGNYYVVYTATKEGVATTTSEKYLIKVSQSTATIEFAENTPFIIPTKVAPTDSVVLPIPTIIEEEEVADPDYTVTVKSPKNHIMTLETVTIEGKEYLVFEADKENDEYVTGNYTIKYKYNANGYYATKTYTIAVVDGYVAPAKANLSYTLSSSFPTSAVLGNKVTLPTPKVVDNSNNKAAVDVYTVVEVKFDGEAVEVDQSDLSFKPMEKATGTSKYEVSYKMYDRAALDLPNQDGKTLAQILSAATPVLTGEYTLSNVEDTEKPSVKVARDYEVTTTAEVKTVADEEELQEKDYSYLMPSVVRVNTAVEVPAIYAYDNYSAYNGLKLTRTVKYNGNNRVIENDVEENTFVTYAKTEPNSKAVLTFLKEGSYEILYRAEDEAGNKSTALTFKITVKAADAKDDIAPYITLPTDVSKSAKVGEKLSFSLPTVVDYELDHTANPASFAVVDAYPETKVYYYLGVWTNEATAADTDAKLNDAIENNEAFELEAQDGKYEFVVPSCAALSIVVRAEDHAKYLAGEANNYAFASKTIAIYSENDTVAPTIVTDLEDLRNDLNMQGANGQGTVIDVLPLEFNDDGSYNSSLMVVDGNGTKLPVSKTQGHYVFTAATAGEYKVTITATDRGGNSVLATVIFEVADTVQPYIVANSSVESGATVTLGEKFEIPVPRLVKNGKVVEVEAVSLEDYALLDSVVAVDFDSHEQPGDYYFDEITWKFEAKAVGTYRFSYLAKDANGNVAENIDTVYEIVVEKSKDNPIIKLDDELDMPTYSAQKDGDDYIVIKLPSFNVESANGVSSAEVKVTGPEGDNVTVKAYDAADNEIDDEETLIAYYGFEATDGVGLYTVTYKAVDAEGLSTTETYTIKVGDTLAPTATGYTNPENKTWTVGDQLEINLKDLAITDLDDLGNETTSNGKDALAATTGIRLTIEITDPNGSVSKLTNDNSDDAIFQTLEKSGEYTLTYTIKDAADNETVKTYHFTVKAVENNTTSAQKAWGIVLIVLSVVLLAGVIIYFVKTRDADKTSLPSKKDDKKENK